MSKKQSPTEMKAEIQRLKDENVALAQVMKDHQEIGRVETDEWVQRCTTWKNRFEALCDAVTAMANAGIAFEGNNVKLLIKNVQPINRSLNQMSNAGDRNVATN